jgi:spore germination cell wall hydrolase CwlJ-like protein
MIINFSTAVAARTLYGEARGETEIGQRAVAWVMRNRLYSGKYGHTLASVCMWPLQFSCWNEKDPNRVKMCELTDSDPTLLTLADMLNTVMNAKSAEDITDGATHYYSPNALPEVTLPVPGTTDKTYVSHVAPSWAAAMQYVGTFGTQRFYREVK